MKANLKFLLIELAGWLVNTQFAVAVRVRTSP